MTDTKLHVVHVVNWQQHEDEEEEASTNFCQSFYNDHLTFNQKGRNDVEMNQMNLGRSRYLNGVDRENNKKIKP